MAIFELLLKNIRGDSEITPSPNQIADILSKIAK